MALVPVRTESSFLESEMDGSVESLGRLLDAQKKIFHSQIDQLKWLVVNQCKLTGVNPLSQEMAAGALSIKIGKKPRDLLNPKAVKYMQSIFAIKDTIGKKETREISALCGVTVTQVRDFFSGQRSKVRKLVSLVREKAVKSDASDAANDGRSTNSGETLLYRIDAPSSAVDVKNFGDLAEVPDSNGNLLAIQYYQNVPVSSIDSEPIQVVAPSSSSQEESIPGIYEDDKKFLENIFNLMRKEGTFSGQVKLMEWILQIHNSAVLVWFLTKGSIPILATWLSQAAIEEQTTLLNVILKVLCHLPLHKALPAQMSSILQTVNKLRFYRTPDISNRAKVLLSRWSKMLVRNQALKYPSILNSSNGVQKDIIRKQRISEILSEEFWRSKIGITDEILALKESSGNDSKPDPKQALKLLTASCNRSSRKQGQSALSINIKERRKVRLVEQLDQKASGRIAQVGRASPSNLSRPISADDIQKAKMRAMFMQHKYGKADASSSEIKMIEDSKDLPAPQSKKILPPPRIMQLEQIIREEKMLADVLRGDSEAPIDTISTGALQEESLERLMKSQFQWQTPPEMKIDSSWRVGEAESSKEVDVQAQRIRREKETFYLSKFDIPPDPKEPWDIEMDFDDSLTPEIPIDQPPDSDAVEDPLDPSGDDQTIPDDMPAAMVAFPPMTAYGNAAEPDLELLAVLLKNPELVFALTSGQGKNLSSDERVALLDMIKHSSVAPGASLTGISSSTSQDKPKDPVPMSLPSPTPPSDVERAAGWRSAFPTVSKAQLPQSQFSCAVRHSAPTLAPTPLPTLMVLPAQAELQSAIVPTSHVLITANTAPQTVAFTSLTSQRPCPLLSQHILPSRYAEPQRLNTESSLLSKRNALSCPASAVPSPTPASFHQDTYCRNSLPTSTVSSQPSLPPPQRRSQSLMISDPSVAAIPPNTTSLSRGDASAEWSERRDMMPEWRDTMPESSTRRQNAKEFTLQGSPRFNASIRDIYFTNQGRSTGRVVEIVGRSRDLETWSPERTLLRSSESRHGHSRSHAESRREQGWNQRHELSRQRRFGHHDQNRSSNGNGGRWRDRDRGR